MISRSTYFIQHRILSVLEAGEAGRPIALFLHGIPANAELWRSVIDRIAAAGWHCLAPDCPGYGRTRMLEGDDYSLQGQAGFFLDWIEQEGWRDIWLVGHDLGGGVAQIMLARRPDLFRRVSLSNCAVGDSWPVPIIRLMRTLARLGLYKSLASAGLMTSPPSLRKLREAVYDRSVLDKDTVNRIFTDSKFKDPEGRQEFARLLKSLDNRDTLAILPALSDVKTPVHLVWGMNDPNQPWAKSGRMLEGAFSNVCVTQLDKAGHFLMLDDPDRYAEALLGQGSGAPS